MISMLRKEACSGSIHDLAHIPTQNCLSDRLTKASAKADNLITAVEIVRGRHATWYRTFMHTKEKDVLFLSTLNVSRTDSTRRTIPCDVCEKTAHSRTKRIKEL